MRLRALARRPPAARPPVLEFADLRLDPYRREAYRDGRYVKLTRKQFAVLELLMRAGRRRGERGDAAREGVGRQRRPAHDRAARHALDACARRSARPS